MSWNRMILMTIDVALYILDRTAFDDDIYICTYVIYVSNEYQVFNFKVESP